MRLESKTAFSLLATLLVLTSSGLASAKDPAAPEDHAAGAAAPPNTTPSPSPPPNGPPAVAPSNSASSAAAPRTPAPPAGPLPNTQPEAPPSPSNSASYGGGATPPPAQPNAWVPEAEAQDEVASAQPVRSGVPTFDEIYLTEPSGWSFGLEGMGGIAVLSNQSTGAAHAFAGALARLRVGYLQFGGTFEQSDKSNNEWRTLGGFAGAFMPFANWVDFDAAIGFASRRHASSDLRYGPGGYSAASPALTLRLGVSDRSSESLLGARVAAYLMGTVDLKHRHVPWSFSIEDDAGQEVVQSGTTEVGGFSVGGVFAVGFDVVPGARPPAPPKKQGAFQN